MISSGWRYAHIGIEGDAVEIDGIKIWESDWEDVDQPSVKLPHPAYAHQIHHFRIYDVGCPPDVVRLAACELSAGVWGFYVPD
jgi:hypothetical protein